jgi:hypothetical protein
VRAAGSSNAVLTLEWLRIDPYLQPLHGNPRFERLLAPATT